MFHPVYSFSSGVIRIATPFALILSKDLANSLLFVVFRGVAIRAKGDEILFLIFSRVTAKLLMVDLEIRHGTAELASPAVALKNALAEFFVVVSSQPEDRKSVV